jgi:hypothetical protein
MQANAQGAVYRLAVYLNWDLGEGALLLLGVAGDLMRKTGRGKAKKK